MPDVTAIVVSWNVRALLVRCIEALQSPAVAGGHTVEVIVVDNASTDGSAQCIEKMPGVTLIKLAENLGYGRASDIGSAFATGRNLLILNPDVILLPGALAALLDFAQRHHRAGIVAPRLLNPDLTVQTSAFRFPTLLMAAIDLFPLPTFVPGRIRQWLITSHANGRYIIEQVTNKPICIDHSLGACMLIKIQAYDECGGFDPQIFMYSEEIDLAMRYKRHGWQCWQVPSARAIHMGGASTKQMPAAMQIELWRSRLYLYRKHRSLTAYIALCALLVVSQLGRVASASAAYVAGKIGSGDARRQFRQASRLAGLALGRG